MKPFPRHRRAGLWRLLAAGLTVPDQKSESHHNTGESRCHGHPLYRVQGRSGDRFGEQCDACESNPGNFMSRHFVRRGNDRRDARRRGADAGLGASRSEVARGGRHRRRSQGAQERLDGRRRRRADVRDQYDLGRRNGGDSRRRRQSSRPSHGHPWRGFEPRGPALSARRRRCDHPVGRARIFPVPAQDQQSGKPGSLHPAPADLGNPRAGGHRHQEHRRPPRQEGQFRSGRQRIEPDRIDRVPALRRQGGADALR